MDNAIKYTSSGSVTVHLSKEREQATIYVIDTGIGIEEEELPKIFDRFYRTKTVTSREGHGVGLAIVKKIVADHKGTITCSSRKNKGTTFIVHFPIMKQDLEKSLG